MPRYPQIEAGQWVTPTWEGYKFACCDCGLVHRMNFRIVDGDIQFQAFRDNRATGQVRRHRKRRPPHKGLCDFLRDAISTGMLDERCHETALKTIARAEEIHAENS